MRFYVVTAACTLVTLVALIAGAMYASGHRTGQPCTFDGGGTIMNGSMATVSTGQTFFCDDGTLVRYYG
jgi:hypothetical protein